MREEAIWSAARSLSQEASLTRRLAAREAAAGRRDTSVQLLQKADSLAQQTQQIREVTRGSVAILVEKAEGVII